MGVGSLGMCRSYEIPETIGIGVSFHQNSPSLVCPERAISKKGFFVAPNSFQPMVKPQVPPTQSIMNHPPLFPAFSFPVLSHQEPGLVGGGQLLQGQGGE